MSKVMISPMPESYKKISMKFRPGIPPIFPDGDPSENDRRLAVKLFLELDKDSRDWYKHNSRIFKDL